MNEAGVPLGVFGQRIGVLGHVVEKTDRQRLCRNLLVACEAHPLSVRVRTLLVVERTRPTEVMADRLQLATILGHKT